MPADDATAELAALCDEQELDLIERIESPDGASRFLAHVVDRTGRHLLLKRGTGLRGHAEFGVLRAWESTGFVPGHLAQIDRDTFLCEWIDAVTFDRASGDLRRRLRRAGEMLRTLHGATPPTGLMPITERASPAWVRRDFTGMLSPEMVERARAAAAELVAYEPGETVLLHGDVVPWNILVAGERMVAIDPIGFTGPAGWDVAQLAIAVGGRDRRANLADLVAGYGVEPARLEAAFRYLAFMFLEKNRELEAANPGTRTAYLAELGALAEALTSEA